MTTKPMNLLILCPHFAPDLAPTGEVMTSIVTALAERGHHLHVITALPWYRDHAVEAGWGGRPWRTERTTWGKITRLHPFPTSKTNIPARAVAFGGFTSMATIAALLSRKRPDAVMVMSPPLPLGISGWLA
ncbi:MAG: glycosyltransferase WbuB, partial [Actinobacteria bacterium]|nr:glycosyltransferase WbuB [Actinomycetota bacterium]